MKLIFIICEKSLRFWFPSTLSMDIYTWTSLVAAFILWGELQRLQAGGGGWPADPQHCYAGTLQALCQRTCCTELSWSQQSPSCCRPLRISENTSERNYFILFYITCFFDGRVYRGIRQVKKHTSKKTHLYQLVFGG